jgi:murein tripeptide amidase MpaA
MQIDSDFEGGSIDVLDASDPSAVTLAIRRDNASDYRQWFYFHVRGAGGVPLALRIVNAGECSYPGGWEGYRGCASYDGEAWFRVPADYEGGALTIRHTPERELVAYACYPYYPSERHEALLESARSSPRAQVAELGRSVEGRPMRAIVIGDQGRPVRRVWIIAHQHPGETMAAWFMEGVAWRLLDEGDPVAAAILERAVVYLVPSMNPDGCARGNHRTNAAGRDLNREWLYPSLEASPEVCAVRGALEQGGVDLFLDVHGDETIPYVFAFGAEGVPDYSERLAGLEELFTSTLERVDGDFQRERGYELDPPGGADLRLASCYVAQRFDCPSQGLEMPFKDNANRPDEAEGWSPERCRGFGRSALEAILACLDALR